MMELRVDRRRKEWKRGRGQYNLGDLSQRHREMLNALALGESNKKVAERFDVTPICVSYTKNSDLGKLRLEEIRKKRDEQVEEILNEVAELAPEAIGVYREIITGEEASLSLKLRAAGQILQHPMISPKTPDSVHQHIHLHQEKVSELRERGLQVARQMGLIASE